MRLTCTVRYDTAPGESLEVDFDGSISPMSWIGDGWWWTEVDRLPRGALPLPGDPRRGRRIGRARVAKYPGLRRRPRHRGRPLAGLGSGAPGADQRLVPQCSGGPPRRTAPWSPFRDLVRRPGGGGPPWAPARRRRLGSRPGGVGSRCGGGDAAGTVPVVAGVDRRGRRGRGRSPLQARPGRRGGGGGALGTRRRPRPPGEPEWIRAGAGEGRPRLRARGVARRRSGAARVLAAHRPVGRRGAVHRSDPSRRLGG